MQVLIVEDDAPLGQFLGHGLKLDGYNVAIVRDGEAALTWAERLQPELMILDLCLPQKDGLEVLAEVGQRCRSTAVMVLTGRAATEERVQCLEIGADDVVLKPFSFYELRARVKALCRRRSRGDETVLRFADLEMDRAERRVTQAGREVELTATEFSLLESLLRRRGERVCSRAELLREAWRSPAGMGPNIVEVYINYLRKKLGRDRGRQSPIRTVRGEGYVLAQSGAPAAEATAPAWASPEFEQRAG